MNFTNESDFLVGVNLTLQVKKFLDMSADFYYNSSWRDQVIMLLALSFFILALITVLYIVIHKLTREQSEKYDSELTSLFESLVLELLYTDPGTVIPTSVINNFNKHLRSDRNRAIFTKVLISLSRSIIGDTAKTLRALYLSLELHEDSMIKFKRKKWHIKLQGMSELAQFEIRRAIPDILKMTHHHNSIVRKEAQVAIVHLLKFDGLSFLKTQTYVLSEWQQLALLEEIQSLENVPIPSFSNSLSHKNPSVLIFFIKLIQLFNQTEAVEHLKPLLYHGDEGVRMQVIYTLGELGDHDSASQLIRLFFIEDFPAQREIVIALSKIGTPKEVDFLIELLAIDNFELNQLTMQALKQIGSNQILRDKSYLFNKQQTMIMDHLLDNRISA